MRDLQDLALDMFESQGFDSVTVEDVAASGGVSASTIYRYFGTKERLITWDETDNDLEASLTRNLLRSPPVTAFRDTLMAQYRDEKANQPLLRRVRFIYNNSQLHAAAIEQDLRNRAELAVGFALVAGRKIPTLEDTTRAGVCMAALDAAIAAWQDEDNTAPLAELIERAFAAARND